MEHMDCIELQRVLSGLLDDELEAEVRRSAERHLVECAACRTLVDRHETLTDDLRAMSPEPAYVSLPSGFLDQVLDRSTRGDRDPRRGWSGVAGWLVAAAAIAVAATVWFVDGPGGGSAPAPSGSLVLDDADGGSDSRLVQSPGDAPAPMDGSTLSDADAIFAASLVIERLSADRPPTEQELGLLRAQVEYDALVDRLLGAGEWLAPADQAIVRRAAMVLRRVTEPGGEQRWTRLRDGTHLPELADRLDELSLRIQSVRSI